MTSTRLQHVAEQHGSFPNPFLAAALGALAGGLGWGIRGQYGHETGAMIAGVLVGFTLALLFGSGRTSLGSARVVALFALGISFGGSMTYGQTIGLTQNAVLVGNWAAPRWGLLGLFIKGGLWIGFGGALLGMGLSRQRYRAVELALLLVAMAALLFVGVWAFNRPFDPAHRVLPRIYFSADWYWEPTSELKPRPECWGGLLLALAALVAYVQWVRRDRLARNMALVAFVAGGIGFAGGQCVQAFHAWNPDLFHAGLLGQLDPYMNWWNMMEISFGAVFGGLLAGGLWLNRSLISREATADDVTVSATWEGVLVAVYVILVGCAEFSNLTYLELFLEFAFVPAILPAIGILGGRYWPYLFTLPLVALPIAGKTLRELTYHSEGLSRPWAWLVLFVVPLTLASVVALWLARQGQAGSSARTVARVGLLFTTWMYFGLNFFFFRFPWPWQEWTGRTPSGIIFTVCALGLTTAAIGCGRISRDGGDRPRSYQPA